MFSKKKKEEELFSEMRKDAVSGEWILVASGRAKRPHAFRRKGEKTSPMDDCPFEGERINGSMPLLWYPHPSSLKKDVLEDWFVQVITNKYPAVMPHADRTCAVAGDDGPYERIDGVGYHEVIITRPHERSLGQMTVEEMSLVIRAYRERFAALKKDPCIQCRVISWELEDRRRIVYENDDFLVIAPYASRISFELRMYPKIHDAHFDLLPEEKLETAADALAMALRKLGAALEDPAYNFFIHTAPTGDHMEHYHWHMEILPKTSVPAGLELGAGVDVTVVKPEDVPSLL